MLLAWAEFPALPVEFRILAVEENVQKFLGVFGCCYPAELLDCCEDFAFGERLCGGDFQDCFFQGDGTLDPLRASSALFPFEWEWNFASGCEGFGAESCVNFLDASCEASAFLDELVAKMDILFECVEFH